MCLIFIASCGSHSDNESLSNPRQTDDPNARNAIADSIHEAQQNSNNATGEVQDTVNHSTSSPTK